jgi:phosphate transport system substrate-binding protein
MVPISEHYSGKGEFEIQVNSCGSLKGVEALLNGTCDVAMCSSPIPADMLANAASKGMQIKGFPFAHDLIVPIVHPSNPIKNLSLHQLAGIY